jgi:hypothetical protein
MAVRTAAHFLHLSSSSYAQHVALGDFYTALTDLIDKYAEVYMGLEDQIKSWPSGTLPSGSPVSVLSDYLLSVRKEQKEDNDSQALLNILAELEELTAQTLYKLKFLK